MNEKKMRCIKKRSCSLFNAGIIIAMLLYAELMSAQKFDQKKIKGTVTSETDGQPLFGVNVELKGTNQKTATDADGGFAITARIGETVVFSYLGFVKEEVKITDVELTIKLKEDLKALNEVVVIGYGKSKRKDLTGAISSVSGEELMRTRPTTIDQALQGKVAGVVVQQTSGQPGGGANIQIRGLSSFGSSSPLYVIDGVIIGQSYDSGNGTNPLATINPSDIQSIDVLKDASATAI